MLVICFDTPRTIQYTILANKTECGLYLLILDSIENTKRKTRASWVRKQLYFKENLVRRAHHQLTQAWKISLHFDIAQPISSAQNWFRLENETNSQRRIELCRVYKKHILGITTDTLNREDSWQTSFPQKKKFSIYWTE